MGKLVDRALLDRLSVMRWVLEQALHHGLVPRSDRKDLGDIGVRPTWYTAPVVLRHDHGESWLSTDLAPTAGGTRRVSLRDTGGPVGGCGWAA